MIEVVESESPYSHFIYVYADRVPVGMIEWLKKGKRTHVQPKVCVEVVYTSGKSAKNVFKALAKLSELFDQKYAEWEAAK